MKILGKLTAKQRVNLPLYNDMVAAGFPSPAQDYVEKSLDLNDLLIKSPPSTYLVRVEGESMVDVGIYPNDLLIVDRSVEAQHGHIVIACLNGEMTVKQLSLKPKMQLIAHNPNYPNLAIRGEDEFELFGVVVHAIRDLTKPLP
ncbi:MAG: translesion error-prone DNA polymerase V autoproteolytic subunit [Pseudomonadota bacterium]|nr:translesion error-prone DNA polymerase V autoproteolytic subunit [Pseudomonadota bacterium]